MMAQRSNRPGRGLEIARQVVLGLTPLVALLLFINTRSWLWFIAIPLVASVLYGPQRRD